ncbi:uncharacterized protein [Ptychodera flava]|uniref:uncharacterized protein n=1 Tax=Ptychodera flava TaxID=63121 RepID=UPI003969EC90
MNVSQLQQFLRNRGIPYSRRRRDELLTLAKNAQNYPVTKSLKEEAEILGKEVSDLLLLEGGLIKLPDPAEITVGWERSSEHFPETTRAEFEEYLETKHKLINISQGNIPVKEGESLYLSGHVTGVEYHSISPNLSYCFVRATVGRQKAQTEAPYNIWVVIHKHTGSVKSAYCTCPAGLRGYCKHVTALLHFIVREVEGGSTRACTSRPQEWHKPHKKGKKLHQPDFVKNLAVRKVKGTFSSNITDNDKPKRSDFDPRAIIYQREKKLTDFNLERLSQITNGNCGTCILLYAPGYSYVNHNTDVFDTDETIPLISQEIIKKILVLQLKNLKKN